MFCNNRFLRSERGVGSVHPYRHSKLKLNALSTRFWPHPHARLFPTPNKQQKVTTDQAYLFIVLEFHVEVVGGEDAAIDALLVAGDSALDGVALRCWHHDKLLQVRHTQVRQVRCRGTPLRQGFAISVVGVLVSTLKYHQRLDIKGVLSMA